MRSLSICLIALFVCGFSCVYAQRANVVVLDDSTSVVVKNQNSYTCYQRKTMLLLNNKAKYMSDICLNMGKNTKLLQYEYVMQETNGTVLRTIKAKDLQRSEYSEELASDDYRLIADATPPHYPIKVTTTVKTACNGNVLGFPAFFPQDRADVEVRNASYVISWNSETAPIHYHSHLIADSLLTKDGCNYTLTYKVNNVKAIADIPYAPDTEELCHYALFVPDNVSYYGRNGSFRSWHDLALWSNELCSNRQTLAGTQIEQVHKAIQSCNTDYEKVAALYKLLRETTRYVSIQLGIGGFQPCLASTVGNMGFSDCKGLSNYMHAMLKEAGIDSRLVMIGTDNKRLFKNCANVQQLNHMVLEAFIKDSSCLNKKDTLWIECTNPQLPLGYIHNRIAGHDAIEVSESGDNLITLPDYADSLNLKKTRVDINMQANMSSDISVHTEYYNHRYDDYYPLLNMKAVDFRRELSNLYDLQNAEYGDISVTDVSKPFVACLSTDLKAQSNSFVNIAGKRIFIRANILHNSFVPVGMSTNGSLSNMPLLIEQGYRNDETVTINIPLSVKLESIPADVSFIDDFASFHQHIETTESSVIVHVSLDMKAGTYPAEKRQRLAEMSRIMSKAYAARIVALLP